MTEARAATINGRLAQRLRVQAADPLLRSAYSLSANVALTAVLGVGFWIVAARLYDADEVGRDAALIAAMVELSTICQLNLVNALTRFLPSLERRTALALVGAYAVSGAAALIVGVAFVVVAPAISEQFSFLRENTLFAALYVVSQILWTWFMLQDAALTAMRRAPWVPVENAVFGALKLGALPLLLALGASHGVFLASALPVVLLLVPINLFLFRRAIPEHLRKERPTGSALSRLGRRRLLAFMAQDYGATVFSQSGMALLPLLIVAFLGSSANAYFYIPYMMVVSFGAMVFGVTTSLVVEGALAEHRIQELARRIVRHFGPILLIGSVVLAAAAPLILLPFGEDYVRESTPVLRILAVGCLFRGISTLYMAVSRLEGRGGRILAVEAVQMALMLAGAAALAHPLGLEGVALSWLGATAIVATAILPSLARSLRAPPSTVENVGRAEPSSRAAMLQ